MTLRYGISSSVHGLNLFFQCHSVPEWTIASYIYIGYIAPANKIHDPAQEDRIGCVEFLNNNEDCEINSQVYLKRLQ